MIKREDTKFELAKIIGVIDDTESMSLSQTIKYSLSASCIVPCISCGLGALTTRTLDYGWEIGG